MALSKQITSIRIQGTDFVNGNVSTTVYEIDVQNFDVSVKPEFYGGSYSTEAVNGYKRSDFRGFRPTYSFRFDTSVEPDVIRDLLNDFVTCLVTNGNENVEISLDGGSNYAEAIPTTSIEYLINFNNTISNFSPTIELEGQDLLTSIPSYLESA